MSVIHVQHANKAVHIAVHSYAFGAQAHLLCGGYMPPLWAVSKAPTCKACIKQVRRMSANVGEAHRG